MKKATYKKETDVFDEQEIASVEDVTTIDSPVNPSMNLRGIPIVEVIQVLESGGVKEGSVFEYILVEPMNGSKAGLFGRAKLSMGVGGKLYVSPVANHRHGEILRSIFGEPSYTAADYAVYVKSE